ncbi:DNA polymerase III subunit chi [Carnimonas nigrificans]|uniref:DNA polymerase III subunit chi n=1 Tax=Carnimonas nigrificans TaxID=64323 RepID=UPI000470A343|nr:DNA polymerase III subunit chi [Carnimonas nigrificans]
MTQIDFYVLPDTTLEARITFACRLAETINHKGYRLHLHANDEAAASEIDAALWTFRPDSFVPHALLGSAEEEHAPITIGYSEPPCPGAEVLLNLADEVPGWFSRFERIAEIINQHQQVLVAKRKSWKMYKERGYPVKAHHLKGQA